eukprot:168876-Ditylum_brightwellii.AAC.1
MPNDVDCPKHGKNHTSGDCCQNPFKKKSGNYNNWNNKNYSGGGNNQGHGYGNQERGAGGCGQGHQQQCYQQQGDHYHSG